MGAWTVTNYVFATIILAVAAPSAVITLLVIFGVVKGD